MSTETNEAQQISVQILALSGAKQALDQAIRILDEQRIDVSAQLKEAQKKLADFQSE